MRVAAVVLAAGSSTRFGKPKQFALFQGETFIRRIVTAAIEADCAPVVVVTGEESTHLTLELTGLSVSIAMNPGWSSAVDRRFVWVSNGRWISQPVFQICCDSKEILEPKESFSRGHTMSSHLIFPPARSTSTPLQIKKGSINPSPQTARGWDSRTFR